MYQYISIIRGSDNRRASQGEEKSTVTDKTGNTIDRGFCTKRQTINTGNFEIGHNFQLKGSSIMVQQSCLIVEVVQVFISSTNAWSAI